MKIGFLILRMNAFPYFIPLADYCKSLGHNVSLIFSPIKDKKYNSFHTNLVNFERGLKYWTEISEKYIECKDENNPLEINDINILFSVEGNGFPKGWIGKVDKHIIIQNYFDHSFSQQYYTTEEIYNTSYAVWFNNQFHADLAVNDLFYKGKILVTELPCYWHYKNKDVFKQALKYGVDASKRKIVTCYLPRPETITTESWMHVRYTPTNEPVIIDNHQMYIQHALDFAMFLEKIGFGVILKQRQKNRIPEFLNFKNYIEDGDQWYPSRPLDLNYISQISYGYRSSSIMDSITFGHKYFDFYGASFAPITEKIFNYYNSSIDIRTTKFEDIDLESRYIDQQDFDKKIDISKEKLREFIDE